MYIKFYNYPNQVVPIPPCTHATSYPCQVIPNTQESDIPEGFYNFSDICVPVDLFTPSLYKFDITGKNIEDDHTMDHEHKKNKYSIHR